MAGETNHGSTVVEHDDHTSGHEHPGDMESLGPVDLVAWGYAIAGGALGLVVALALYVATGR